MCIIWHFYVYSTRQPCSHPAECLHAGVDMGPLKAGESRMVGGKFYWLAGTKDDVYAL
jgi:hypothetical protein